MLVLFWKYFKKEFKFNLLTKLYTMEYQFSSLSNRKDAREHKSKKKTTYMEIIYMGER